MDSESGTVAARNSIQLFFTFGDKRPNSKDKNGLAKTKNHPLRTQISMCSGKWSPVKFPPRGNVVPRIKPLHVKTETQSSRTTPPLARSYFLSLVPTLSLCPSLLPLLSLHALSGKGLFQKDSFQMAQGRARQRSSGCRVRSKGLVRPRMPAAEN